MVEVKFEPKPGCRKGWSDFRIGQRVRVHISGVDLDSINCDVGYIRSAFVKFPRTPTMRQVYFYIVFDDYIFKLPTPLGIDPISGRRMKVPRARELHVSPEVMTLIEE